MTPDAARKVLGAILVGSTPLEDYDDADVVLELITDHAELVLDLLGAFRPPSWQAHFGEGVNLEFSHATCWIIPTDTLGWKPIAENTPVPAGVVESDVPIDADGNPA